MAITERVIQTIVYNLSPMALFTSFQHDVTCPCKYSEEGMWMRAIFITCNLTWLKVAEFFTHLAFLEVLFMMWDNRVKTENRQQVRLSS